MLEIRKKTLNRNEEFLRFSQRKELFLEKNTKKLCVKARAKRVFEKFLFFGGQERRKGRVLPFHKSTNYNLTILNPFLKKNPLNLKKVFIRSALSQKQTEIANVLKRVKGGYSLDMKGGISFIPQSHCEERKLLTEKNYFLQTLRLSLTLINIREEKFFLNRIASRTFLTTEIKKTLKWISNSKLFFTFKMKNTFKNKHKVFCLRQGNETKIFLHKQVNVACQKRVYLGQLPKTPKLGRTRTYNKTVMSGTL